MDNKDNNDNRKKRFDALKGKDEKDKKDSKSRVKWSNSSESIDFDRSEATILVGYDKKIGKTNSEELISKQEMDALRDVEVAKSPEREQARDVGKQAANKAMKRNEKKAEARSSAGLRMPSRRRGSNEQEAVGKFSQAEVDKKNGPDKDRTL